MPLNLTSLIAKPGAKALAISISFSVAGPLGALTGAFLGALMSESVAEFAQVGVEKLVEAMGEGLLGSKLEALAERLKRERPRIEPIHREAVRQTLQQIARDQRAESYRDWFRHWDACLRSPLPLDLEELSPQRAIEADPDQLLRATLERIDAQGATIQRNSLSLNRRIEPALVELVNAGIGAHFEANLRALLASPENEVAWKIAVQATVDLIPSIKKDTTELLLKVDEVLRRLPPEGLARLVQAAQQPDPAQQKQLDQLAADLRVTRDAISGFFSIVREEEVSVEQLPARLALIAQRHIELLDRLSVLDPEDESARLYIQQARDLIATAKDAAEYDRADELLSRAENAQEETLLRAETLEHQAAEAARRLRVSSAATRAERAQLSLIRLRYLDAAAHFRAAAHTIGNQDAGARFDYLLSSANALQSHGDEMGDNVVLGQAIESYKDILQEFPHGSAPMNWAATQNNLGNALRSLGEHESGTSRLEESVTAYRAALEERTRERVPLDWAATHSNLGAALRILGERENRTELLRQAAEATRAAWDIYHNAGMTHYDADFRSRIADIEALIASRS